MKDKKIRSKPVDNRQMAENRSVLEPNQQNYSHYKSGSKTDRDKAENVVSHNVSQSSSDGMLIAGRAEVSKSSQKPDNDSPKLTKKFTISHVHGSNEANLPTKIVFKKHQKSPYAQNESGLAGSRKKLDHSPDKDAYHLNTPVVKYIYKTGSDSYISGCSNSLKNSREEKNVIFSSNPNSPKRNDPKADSKIVIINNYESAPSPEDLSSHHLDEDSHDINETIDSELTAVKSKSIMGFPIRTKSIRSKKKNKKEKDHEKLFKKEDQDQDYREDSKLIKSDTNENITNQSLSNNDNIKANKKINQKSDSDLDGSFFDSESEIFSGNFFQGNDKFFTNGLIHCIPQALGSCQTVVSGVAIDSNATIVNESPMGDF